MDVTRSIEGGVLLLKVEGRIDSYWADHLDATLADAVGEGHHRIALDCSNVNFLSSAGISVLVKRYRELSQINGAFRVVNPAGAVATMLRITNLADLLIGDVSAVAGTGTVVAPVRRAEAIDADGLSLDVFELGAANTLTLQALGTPEPLARGTFAEPHCVSMSGASPAFAIGVGAFGAGFAACRRRFGEMISVAGATAYQPADGTNVADYLVARGPLGSDVRLLYGLACDGAFSHLVRFEPKVGGTAATPSRLAEASLRMCRSEAVGIVMVAETAGLVGAALRRSPAEALDGVNFFHHPSVRTRLSYAAERAYAHSVSLVAGLVARRSYTAHAAQLRPLGGDCIGHLHAAAFHFRPIQKNYIDLAETVTRLFEPDQLMGVMHLLNDDRGAGGAGESELVRGACWVAPVA